MKKYLMTGAAALTLAFVNVGCSSDSEVYNPGATTVHSDFQKNFAQTFGNIDPNHDWGFTSVKVAAGTRSANVNRNEWGTGNGIGGYVSVPENVTTNERKLVYDWFNQERKVWTSTQVNWNSYFISEVWKGEAEYYDWGQYNWTYAKGTDPVRGELKSGATKFLASDKMNHLQVRYGDGSIDANGNLVGAWEHANDFNSGNHNSSYGTIEGHTYMENSGTLEFAYHNSMDSKYHNEYIIVPGEVIDPSLAGYYYVGFDFLANDFYVQDDSGAPQHLNMCADRDWYYTDWIVRISPAEYIGGGLGRIIAEDLAAGKSDFDYNDVVFDVLSIGNKWNGSANELYAKVAILAAGGTMPLWIGGKEKGVEVHDAFGVSTKTMVNTSNGTVNKPVAIKEFSLGRLNFYGDFNLKEIPIVVETANGDITLDVETGRAPEMIQVEKRYKWCDERQQIQTRYDKFPLWVSDRSVAWY